MTASSPSPAQPASPKKSSVFDRIATRVAQRELRDRQRDRLLDSLIEIVEGLQRQIDQLEQRLAKLAAR